MPLQLCRSPDWGLALAFPPASGEVETVRGGISFEDNGLDPEWGLQQGSVGHRAFEYFAGLELELRMVLT